MVQKLVNVFPWRFSHGGFKDPVKIGDAVKSAFICHRRYAIIRAVDQFFTGFINAHLVKKRHKG